MNRTNALAREGKINENANIRDQHSIIINASIEKVWKILTDFNEWPSWNSEISKVALSGTVQEGTTFSWTLNGNKHTAQIQLCKEPSELAWSGKSKWIKGIHAWQLESDENQTIVTLSTSLQGAFIFFVNSHQKVYNELLQWLEKLKAKAEAE